MILRDTIVAIRPVEGILVNSSFKISCDFHEERYFFYFVRENGVLKFSHYLPNENYTHNVAGDIATEEDFIYYDILSATYDTYEEAYAAAKTMDVRLLWHTPLPIK